MDDFRGYLLARGAASVSCFSWNGGIVRGFRCLDAPLYAARLADDQRRAVEAGSSLSIVSKSVGGLIAERALLLRDDIHVDVFLRIGVPDRRTALHLRNVARIVNITSPDDFLYRLGRWISPLFVNDHGNDVVSEVVDISAPTLSHHALTTNTAIPAEAGTTYELYARLLTASPRGKEQPV